MDFIDLLKQHSSRAEKMYKQIQTEEATKTSLIMPFFQQVLGYDIFNPDEFVPEYTTDVGTKQGEKVDYAICMNGDPVIIIETKWCGEPLDKHMSQLLRYYGVTTARIGILTNGIIYRFFTDLESKNKMDMKPFLDINIFDIKDAQIAELKKFHKANFDIDTIMSTASELKYSNEFKTVFSEELQNPTDDFVRFFLNYTYSGTKPQTYEGLKTQAVIDRFRPVLKKALNQYISDTMNQKIKDALSAGTESKQADISANEPSVEESPEPVSKIVTTNEEIEAFYVIKSMLVEVVNASDISYRDTETYFSVLFNDKVTKWICRLYFGTARNQLVIPDDNKNLQKYNFDSIDDLYAYKEQLINSVKRFVGEPATV